MNNNTLKTKIEVLYKEFIELNNKNYLKIKNINYVEIKTDGCKQRTKIFADYIIIIQNHIFCFDDKDSLISKFWLSKDFDIKPVKDNGTCPLMLECDEFKMFLSYYLDPDIDYEPIGNFHFAD